MRTSIRRILAATTCIAVMLIWYLMVPVEVQDVKHPVDLVWSFTSTDVGCAVTYTIRNNRLSGVKVYSLCTSQGLNGAVRVLVEHTEVATTWTPTYGDCIPLGGMSLPVDESIRITLEGPQEWALGVLSQQWIVPHDSLIMRYRQFGRPKRMRIEVHRP